MRKAALKKARETLEGMRSQLLRSVSQKDRTQGDQVKDDGMDTYDIASDARDREISNILNDRERDKLAQIDDALNRVDAGEYGICEECGSEIGDGRLAALPFTRLCVNCQSDRERESKLNRRFEEDRSYRRLGTSDADDDGS